MTIIWSDYIKYRADLRGFELGEIEDILRHSVERYFDTTTRRRIVIGKASNRLVMIPYDQKENSIVPVTVHATTRQQITFRLKTGRFTND